MTRIAVLFAIAVSALAGAQTPVPNRPGEAAFRSLLKALGALGETEVLLRTGNRPNPKGGILEPSRWQLFYRSPKVFRIEQASFMGGGSRTISDGTVLHRDTLGPRGPVTLSDMAESINEAAPTLRLGTAPGIFVACLQGEAAFERIVKTDGAIVAIPGGVMVETGSGWAAFLYTESGGKPVLNRIDLERRTEGTEPAKTYDEVLARNPSSVEIWWVSTGKKLDDALFDTKAPAEVDVLDRRTKKPG